MRRICPRCNGKASVVEESLGRIDRMDPRYGTPRYQVEAMVPILSDVLDWLRGVYEYAPDRDALASAGAALSGVVDRLEGWAEGQRRAEGEPEPPPPHDPACQRCEWCKPFEVLA